MYMGAVLRSDISTRRSSVRLSDAPLATSAASMFTSLMSFTITATRRPSRLASTRLSSVVYPAPRKPDSTVMGSRSSTIERWRGIGFRQGEGEGAGKSTENEHHQRGDDRPCSLPMHDDLITGRLIDCFGAITHELRLEYDGSVTDRFTHGGHTVRIDPTRGMVLTTGATVLTRSWTTRRTCEWDDRPG